MEDYQKYEELRLFLGSPLWLEELKPKMERWIKGKEEAMTTAKTPAELWDARTAAAAAKEAMPLINNALEELRRKVANERPKPLQDLA